MHSKLEDMANACGRWEMCGVLCFTTVQAGCNGDPALAACQRPQLLAYIGREPPGYYQQQPRQQQQPQPFGKSAVQLGCMIWVVLAAIRFFIALPGWLHGASTNVAHDLQLNNCSVDVLSSDGGYTTLTWHVAIRNTSTTRHIVSLKCDFEEAAGLVVATDHAEQVEVNPGETLNFKDNHSVTDKMAQRIKKIEVRVY
jgi:hypothetical protein